jgi:hypothetical protein
MSRYKKQDETLIFSERDSAWVQQGIEIRCPGPSTFNKLFLILLQEHMPQEGMLMEIACADCAKWARSHGAPGVARFLHYYDSSGTCVNNRVMSKDGIPLPLFVEQ